MLFSEHTVVKRDLSYGYIHCTVSVYDLIQTTDRMMFFYVNILISCEWSSNFCQLSCIRTCFL